MQPRVVSTDGLISVVVPVYNGVTTLPECLAGLKNQTLAPERYEVTVVDDGSTDGSGDAAARSGVRVIRQAHRGAAAARNAGIAAAHGELVLFTDADCSPAPDWIEQMAGSMADPAISGAKGAYRTRQRGIIARFVQAEYQDRYDRMSGRETIDFVDTYAAAYRRNLLVESGGFDETFPGAAVEDVDLSYRLASQGHRMVFNPRAIVCHRHPSTLLRYLSRKASYGYWRVPIYARYPAKTSGDSHTPPILKWQLGLVAAALVLAPAVALVPAASRIWLAVMVAFLVSTIPFCIKVLRRDALVAPLCPMMLWLRAVAIGLGLAWGLVHLARARRTAGRGSRRRPESVAKE